MKLIVGLGNPGKEYENTRHNAGFMALDTLAAKMGLKWNASKKFNAEIIKEGDVLLIKPQTYMNLSGDSVMAALSFYGLAPKNLGIFKKKNADLSSALTVIHDDLDIELGKYKVSIGSRSAGNRGVQSIIDRLSTKNFRRIRIGIKPPAGNPIPADKYVLQKFDGEELKKINSVIGEISDKEKLSLQVPGKILSV